MEFFLSVINRQELLIEKEMKDNPSLPQVMNIKNLKAKIFPRYK